MTEEQAIFWQAFLEQQPSESDCVFGSAWSFGDSPEMADELAQLVLDGQKTTTTGSLIEYELAHEALPPVDPERYDILLNGQDEPVAILQTTNVYVTPFAEVTAEHAYREGEGDRSLAYWRTVHRQYWERIFNELHVSVEIDTMDVVCEEFRVVYQK